VVQLVPDDEQALDAADAAEMALARLNERMAELGAAGRFRLVYEPRWLYERNGGARGRASGHRG